MTPIPGKAFQIAGVLTLSGIAAAIISGSSREPAVSAPVATKFEARWDSVTADDYPLLKKQDRIVAREVGPVVVRTETILMARPEQRVEVKKAEPKKTAERDVCQKHGMHKEWTVKRHWKSWRCRR